MVGQRIHSVSRSLSIPSPSAILLFAHERSPMSSSARQWMASRGPMAQPLAVYSRDRRVWYLKMMMSFPESPSSSSSVFQVIIFANSRLSSLSRRHVVVETSFPATRSLALSEDANLFDALPTSRSGLMSYFACRLSWSLLDLFSSFEFLKFLKCCEDSLLWQSSLVTALLAKRN